MMDIVLAFSQAIGEDKVLTGRAVSERMVHVWETDEPLLAKAVILPRSTEEISKILKICNCHNQPVVIHGGLTNLVSSTKSNQEEVVISLEKMNAIEEIDEQCFTVTAQAGAIVEHVMDAVKDKGFMFPMNFGAKGSAQVGGIVSTNAGGLRVFRYGATRNLVLGLEIVLADGTIISSLKKIIKDNTAYDLKHLFIGSEGTLGVVTRAVFRLVPLPKTRNSAFVAFNDYDKVIEFLKYISNGLAGTLSGYELMFDITYKTQTSPPSTLKPPLPYGYKYYVLLETLGGQPQRDQQTLEELLGQALEEEFILDATVAQNDSALEWFWNIREDVGILASQCKYNQHFDISLPIAHIGREAEKWIEKLSQVDGVEQVFPFGHVADGNLHLVIGKNSLCQELTEKIASIVYAPLQDLGGSISAEHGIGLDKKRYLHLSRTSEELQIMKTLKHTLDPNNIFNRGKVID